MVQFSQIIHLSWDVATSGITMRSSSPLWRSGTPCTSQSIPTFGWRICHRPKPLQGKTSWHRLIPKSSPSSSPRTNCSLMPMPCLLREMLRWLPASTSSTWRVSVQTAWLGWCISNSRMPLGQQLFASTCRNTASMWLVQLHPSHRNWTRHGILIK